MAELAPSRFNNVQELSHQLHSIIDYIRFAMSEFNQHDVYFGHGTENPWQEAHRLVFSALALPLDISPQEQAVFYPCTLTHDERATILSWIKTRCEEGLPLPYLTQQAWFAGMPFFVDERVLIPRSPFAELIANKFSDYVSLPENPTILDMCTGGGCIAIALAFAFEEAQVDAVDIDSDALDVASFNIASYQLDERVFPMQSDLFSNLGEQKYDLLVVNPPYVDAEDMDDLPREYHHEPELALASGEDGLDLTLQLLKSASKHMNENAWLFVEVGNSEVNFADRFAELKVHWCELSQGGSGIFAINKAQLDAQAQLLENLE
ncbi:50S ribosomal protein L3 N(5)-glutamine methyltransferase [Glaciecola sp. 2405UD65-10]|jgi:ribosomal protein L3 glutamine methyltransferase|uniref:50S ribosomal protein L3 N(5)-glutamine methyltransferase n=1 Tax=Glaciecola sp. 2405UD65-10 TaxID=3397244 RepID=UPI003B5B2A8C